MPLGFADPISALFFVVLGFYYLLIVIITMLPHGTDMTPHHYQVGLAILLSGVISLIFWKKFGQNDLVIGAFWGSIILGTVSFIIDIGDFKKHVNEVKTFLKKL